MPELPEVETVRRGLARRLEGRTFARVLQRRADLRVPFPPGFAAALEGRRVLRVGRRAKYILIHLDDGNVLILHLGMSGRFIVREAPSSPPQKHDHVVFETDESAFLTFRDPRRFGLMALARESELARHPLLERLGPEPLEDGFDGPALAARLEAKHGSIKAALLDQRVVAGLGNIYACESLYWAGLSPRRHAFTVQGRRAARLAGAIRRVLEEALAAGGSSLRDYVRIEGELGRFQDGFAVYGRSGAPCPACDCAGGIRHLVQGGRATFYCPTRQR